jgi:hypothetical protein
MSLLMLLILVSEEFVSEFSVPGHLSLSGSYPVNLSRLGDPTDSSATADLAVRFTGTHKPLQYGKVEILLGGCGI